MTRLLLSALIIAIAAVCLGAARQETRMVPATTRFSALVGAAPLAYALSGLGVPLGLVTAEDPFGATERTLLPSKNRMPLSDVLAMLVSQHPRYAAGWTDGVLGIRDQRLACAKAVDDTVAGPLTLDGDMLRLFMLLAWVASGQTGPVAAGNINVMAGEGAAESQPAPPRALHVAVPAGATLARALDLVVSEAGGGAWVVWEHEIGATQVGCRMIGYSSDGVTTAASSRDFKTLP